MTVIAWKDGRIAADRQTCMGVLKRETKKLVRDGNHVLAFTGPIDYGLAMIRWKKAGAIPKDFPVTQSQDDYALLIDASFAGVFLYYQTLEAVVQPQPFWAVGEGAQVAIGAMAAGASAREAVLIAQEFCHGCGYGVDEEAYL